MTSMCVFLFPFGRGGMTGETMMIRWEGVQMRILFLIRLHRMDGTDPWWGIGGEDTVSVGRR